MKTYRLVKHATREAYKIQQSTDKGDWASASFEYYLSFKTAKKELARLNDQGDLENGPWEPLPLSEIVKP